MKANELKLEELIDIKEGKIELKGRRLVIHSINAFANLRHDLFKTLRYQQVRHIFTRFGYFWGHADAAAMKRIFKWANTVELLKACARLHSLQGVTRATIEKLEFDEKEGRFFMEIVWHNSGEAEEHLLEIGKSKEPVCWMLVGYASGYATFCLGKNVYFIENKCKACGDNVCIATGKDESSWGDKLKTIVSFYQTEDIKTKIKNLTEELKKKTMQLKIQSEKLSIIEGMKDKFLVEIHSKSFQKVFELATRTAKFDSSILITGETGTGKEVMARYIHQNSQRSTGPFVAINCGAFPDTLLESELFGYKAGAFTGATHDRIGLFEEANGGTIFLDEIGEISLAMQIKLLRVLQEREIIRLGENKPRKINIRVISATNKDLDKLVLEGKFREDLLYRLKIIEIKIPSLRERKEDILPLARFIIKKIGKKLNIPNLRFDATCIDYLQSYNWPGNIRELENALERAAIIATENLIKPEHLPASITHSNTADNIQKNPLFIKLSELEESHIKKTLALCNGNKTQTAKILGISQATLWRKLKKLNLI